MRFANNLINILMKYQKEEEKDRKINIKEFNEYYNNVSASIDNDSYFELMITNAWNLNNVNYSKGWGGEI